MRRTDLVSEPNRLYHREIAAFVRTCFRNDLARVALPMLRIYGDSDAIVPFEVSGKRSHEALYQQVEWINAPTFSVSRNLS